MWFSLTEETKMPTQRQLMAALDAALSAQVNLLFSKMASAASGADPEGRFAAGIKNASFFYDKTADIIRDTVHERQAALAPPRRRKRQAPKSLNRPGPVQRTYAATRRAAWRGETS